MKTILYIRSDIVQQKLIAGGSVTHTVGVINGFLDNGFRIVCASSCMIEAIQDQCAVNSCITLKNPTYLAWLRWRANCFISTFFFAQQIWKSYKNHSIDFIYQRYSILNASGVILKYLFKKPLVLEFNGSESWIARHWDTKKYIRFVWLISLIEMLNLKYADSIIVVSKVLRDELIKRTINGAKILVNPNGVNAEIANPAKFISSPTIAINSEKKFVFGFVGTFSQWHGINILEQLIPALSQENEKFHFLLIGDGPLKNHLEQKIISSQCQKNVTFTGLIPETKALEYLSACDVFLAPNQPNPDGSRFFGSPTKLFVYMSMAKPIIASDLEQLSEILQPAIKTNQQDLMWNRAAGLLAQPTDWHDFFDLALLLYEQPIAVHKQMGMNARNLILDNYTWQLHTKKIEYFINENQE